MAVDLKKIVPTVRKVLGVITDLLLVGRARGWWSRTFGDGGSVEIKKPR